MLFSWSRYSSLPLRLQGAIDRAPGRQRRVNSDYLGQTGLCWACSRKQTSVNVALLWTLWQNPKAAGYRVLLEQRSKDKEIGHGNMIFQLTIVKNMAVVEDNFLNKKKKNWGKKLIIQDPILLERKVLFNTFPQATWLQIVKWLFYVGVHSNPILGTMCFTDLMLKILLCVWNFKPTRLRSRMGSVASLCLRALGE